MISTFTQPITLNIDTDPKNKPIASLRQLVPDQRLTGKLIMIFLERFNAEAILLGVCLGENLGIEIANYFDDENDPNLNKLATVTNNTLSEENPELYRLYHNPLYSRMDGVWELTYDQCMHALYFTSKEILLDYYYCHEMDNEATNAYIIHHFIDENATGKTTFIKLTYDNLSIV